MCFTMCLYFDTHHEFCIEISVGFQTITLCCDIRKPFFGGFFGVFLLSGKADCQLKCCEAEYRLKTKVMKRVEVETLKMSEMLHVPERDLCQSGVRNLRADVS